MEIYHIHRHEPGASALIDLSKDDIELIELALRHACHVENVATVARLRPLHKQWEIIYEIMERGCFLDEVE